MPKYDARAALSRMNMREALVAPHYQGLLSDMKELAGADHDLEEAALQQRQNNLLAAYGFSPSSSDKPFAFANGFAVIPVHGTLINRFSSSWGFVTGYNFLRSQVQAAVADPDVKAVVLDVNSYGGEAAGCFELADDIYAARSEKPILAVVDSNCYSAAYAIASAATKVIVTPSGGAGSIGVVAMHVNLGKMLEEWGVEITFIYAGDHKVDGNPYEALSPEVKKDIQAGVDKSYDAFVSQVARNRSLDTQVVRGTQARIFRADDALALGLIDAVQTPSQAVQAFSSELSGSNDNQEQMQMAQETKQPGAENATASAKEGVVDTAAVTAEATKAERARVNGILSCEAAAGKSKLASHLALNTDMSVEDATAILAAAAPEVAPEKAATEDKSGSAFLNAMDAGKHPNVGADGAEGGEGGGQEMSASQRILAAQFAATGVKAETKH